MAFSAQRLKSFSCSLLCSIQYTSNKLSFSFSFSFSVSIFYPTLPYYSITKIAPCGHISIQALHLSLSP
uniref:Uncharacterized protein n=1 Tax=Uncultured archaeon GZfos26G2 TaxID=3386331 RepID=Q649K8_UNCAG|nr:hypothetical protein GZ34H9_37 [uncultured archaeon GZfos34H9]